MIERLTGKVVEVATKHVVIDVNGVGYLVFVANSSSFMLQGEVTVFVNAIFNQDKGLVLYGFDSTIKRELFANLINCHKIGPQTALGILSNVVSPELCKRFIDCIVKGREDLLVQYFKITPKTAASVVAELKEKILKINVGDSSLLGPSQNTVDFSEVIQALRAMGYKDLEIMPAIKTVYSDREGDFDDFALTLKKVLAAISRLK